MTDLLREERKGTVVLTLNRPHVRNAISQALAENLQAALLEIEARRDIRVVVIAGAGDQAFSAGTDLKERRGLDPEGKWRQSGSLRRVTETIWKLPQPVIAAVHGWCLGGGFELACSCDIRIAAENAVFAWPEMQLGAYPGGNAGIMFPRMVGRSRAKELFFTARRINAADALKFGVVERVVPPGGHVAAALELAREITANSSPLGAAAAKRMVNFGSDLTLAEAGALNDELRRPLEASLDYDEGIRAFFEKRKPVWRGE